MMKKLSEEEGIKEITNLRKTIDLSVTIMQMYGMLGHTYKDERVNDEFYLDSVANKLAIIAEIIKETLESIRSEEHTSELQSRQYLVCRLLLEKKNKSR